MSCLGTNLCEIATGTVTLPDGSTVCNACEWHRNECEAERLMTLPMASRHLTSARREDNRSPETVARLKAAMERIHARRRK